MESEHEKCTSLPDITNSNKDHLPLEEEKKENEVNKSSNSIP